MSPRIPAIELDRLCVRYGAASALEDVTLAVKEGEILGLIGRAGAGKSTLLKSIQGLAEPAGGTILLFGEPHDRLASRDRLAYLPDRFRPPGHMSGREFLAMTLAVYRQSVAWPAMQAAALRLALEPGTLGEPVQGYSKSMAQKLGLLAVLLTGRPTLLLDEPLSGLDPTTRQRIKDELAAEGACGRTILFSSPMPTDHEELADRIAVLRQGRLCYLGSPASLMERQRAPTLASALLGEMEAGPAAFSAWG